MPSKAVLFDLDGVLVDSMAPWMSLTNETLVRFGSPPLTRGEFLSACWGKTFREVLDNRLKENDIQSAYGFAVERSLHHFRDVEVFEGTVDSLIEMRNSGVSLAIVSNSPVDFLNPLLEASGIRKFFDISLGSVPGVNPKPHPDMLNIAMRKLCVSPENSMMVGDRESDILAAKNAGIKSVIFRNVSSLADHRVDDIREIIGIL